MSNLYASTALGATRRSDSQRRPSAPFWHRDGSDPAPEFPTASDGLGSPRELLPYCDVVGVWLRDPLGPDDLACLQSLCGGMRTSRWGSRFSYLLNSRHLPESIARKACAGQRSLSGTATENARLPLASKSTGAPKVVGYF
jgi:hypothetical protein